MTRAKIDLSFTEVGPFKKGQKPLDALRFLLGALEEKMAKANADSDKIVKAQLIHDALNLHFIKMGSLSTIYKGGSTRTDKLKSQIRAVYEKLVDLEIQYPYSLVLEDIQQKEKLKQEQLQQEKLQEEQLKQEQLKQDQLKQDQLKQDQLKQEQLRKEEQFKQMVAASLKKVDDVLDALKTTIGGTDQHKFAQATDQAQKLLASLTLARTQYQANLQSKMPADQANKIFKADCTVAINEAKPILERDLGWGDYLNNILKALVNALITGVTFGYSRNFFTPVRSQSVLLIEQAEKDFELEGTSLSA